MLHVRRRVESVAAWSAKGSPPAWPWAIPEAPLLYWALTEAGPAVRSRDLDALDDLLLEIGALLERLWTTSPRAHPGRTAVDAVAVSTTLWSELQRGRGAADPDQLAVHLRLLRRLVTPPVNRVPARPATAVPAYRPPADRIAGGQLPVITRPTGLAGRSRHEQFLLLLAVVLSNAGGHLADYQELGRPLGTDSGRIGWPADSPAGIRLGSIRTGRGHLQADPDGDLLLRPGPCLTAVNRALARRPVPDAPAPWTADDIGWALAEAWLVDTTLVLQTDRISREHTAALPVLAGARPERVWRLPLGVYAPGQFYVGDGEPRRGRLRSVRRSAPDHRRRSPVADI